MTKKLVDIDRKYQELTYELSGTVDEVIERLRSLKEETPEGSTLILDYDTKYGSWGDDNKQVVFLRDRRLETDLEYGKRLYAEAVAREQSIEQKRAQLAVLKKELGED